MDACPNGCLSRYARERETEVEDLSTGASEQLNQAADQAKDAAGGALDRAQEAASGAMERA
jgi:hypothetical protein